MGNTVIETLGLQVRVERVKRRLKQSELAALAGVGQADVNQLELDKKLVPARRRRILVALGIGESRDGW
ncbi:MAG: transcriptional regulator [Dehalococcoidia bacterium]